MTNNDILRRLRYTFHYTDEKMKQVFKIGLIKAEVSQIKSWLKKDLDPDQFELSDRDLAGFLNGLITLLRGAKEGVEMKPEDSLNNNQIFMKLKIALNLRDTDILDIMKSVNFYMSKHELSAFFRKPTQSQYRECKNQILRNFLHGIQLKYRPNEKLPE